MPEPFLVRLPTGGDLLESIAEAFRRRSIRKGAFTVIGAVTDSVIGYFDHKTRQYTNKHLGGVYEIVACTGNISERDNEIFVHAHIVLSDDEFQCFGGHLMPGTVTFVGELHGMEVPGPVPVRTLREDIGLALWDEEQ
ncbi:MAG: PPC domain-containing DNA-binding protein [Thermodesulfobacteriota bacterium]